MTARIMTSSTKNDQRVGEEFAEEGSFPRGLGLPGSTPAFFAQHKERYLRQLMIRDIELLTGRRLLVAFSNPDRRPGFRSRDLEGFREILSDLGADEEFDLLIESPGGETDVAESIISMFRRAGNSFRAVVPGHAKSNATLLALAAESIVMLPSSEIGPIDPIIGGRPANILVQTSQPDSEQTNERIVYHTARDAIAHTKKIATDLLNNGMMKDHDTAEIENTVEKLCQSEPESTTTGIEREYYSHSATICHDKAKKLKLSVTPLEFGDQLERRFVFLHAMYTQDCRNLSYDKLYETRRVSNIHIYDYEEPSV